MFKFAKSGSALFRILSWLFVATLFSDCANLLDLVRDVVPLHDDFDVAASHDRGVAFAGCGVCAHQPFSTVGNIPGPHAPAGMTVIDQDSPSLEPLVVQAECASLFTPLDAPAELHNAPLQAEHLHILFRSLLI